MEKKDLIDRSPVRFFEKSLNGGVKPGEIGVIASKKGLGKTSVLVQIGLDMLLQGKQVIHISFHQHSDYVITWYEDIFNEMAKKKNLDRENDIKEDVLKKRIILNFNQDIVSKDQILQTIQALISGGISVQGVIIDGMDFARIKREDIVLMKEFVKKTGLVLWYSSNTEESDRGIPAVLSPMQDLLDIIIFLEPKPDCINLKVLKEHGTAPKDMDLKLDAKTLLIAEK
jgi:archaellum biogenesis ATPase FlaH